MAETSCVRAVARRGWEERCARAESRGLWTFPRPPPASPELPRPRHASPAPEARLGPRDAAGCAHSPAGARGAAGRRGSRPPRTVASAWRGRSLCHPGWGRCREAEPPLFRSWEPGNTRDTRRRRSGAAPACCRPAASPRGDARGRARGAHPGRARRRLGVPGGAVGEGRGRPHPPGPLTASTSNFLKTGSDAEHPASVGACRRAL